MKDDKKKSLIFINIGLLIFSSFFGLFLKIDGATLIVERSSHQEHSYPADQRAEGKYAKIKLDPV